MSKNSILSKIIKCPLVLKILIGLLAGILLGLVVPSAGFLTLLGTLFISALKAIAPVLVFILICSSLCDAGKGISSRFRTVILLYVLSTLVAAFVAVCGSFLFPVTVALDVAAEEAAAPHNLVDVFSNLLTSMVQNPVSAVANANYLGILTWSITLGLAMRKINDPTKQVMKDISSAVSTIVGWIIQCAPLGILGIVYTTVSTNGLGIFVSYGKLIVLLVSCMILQAIIVNPAIVAVMLKQNPYPLVFKCLRNSAITAFFTRSSAANIPVNMKLCEDLGLEKNYYSVSIPLGATINMDGAAVTIAIMSLAAAHSMGIPVSFPEALLLCVVSTFAACGASGVAGGSLLLIPMACSLLTVPQTVAMQMVSIGFIIGVIQDSLETALNSSSDVLLTATAEFYEEKRKADKC